MSEITIGQSALLTDIAMCINSYRLSSPGLYCCTKVLVELDVNTVLRPDLIVTVGSGIHQQCRPASNFEHFIGPPNFVLDVFPHDSMLNYEERRATLERAGVLEYVVLQDTESVNWIWNRLSSGQFDMVEAESDGNIQSSALPGLWIPVQSLERRDWWRVMAMIAQGVTRRPHHEFMASVWK